MIGRRRLSLALIIFLQVSQGFVGAYEVQAVPKYSVVNPGEPVTFMCKLNGKLDICLFQIAGKSYSIKPGKENEGIVYSGNGLEQGECGITVKRVENKHNGNVSCHLFLDSGDNSAQIGDMRLVVALAPQKPELEVSVGTEGNTNIYRERDQLTAMCSVRDGRPSANLTWFLGEDKITDGLMIPVETCTPQNKELCTIQQNLTRTLQATDDKKILKCVANHYSLRGEGLKAEYRINVNYPPKALYEPSQHFGLVEGAVGRVPVTIEANPKPVITWSIGKDNIYENSNIGRYTVEPTVQKGPGQFETVLVIDPLTMEDTDKEYSVTAHNELGEQHYSVSISTSPGPKVLEMGTGLILIIVAGVLFIVLILTGVCYARAKGKCCFAGADSPRHAGESSDTESAEHTTDHKPKLTFVSVFKKKSDKVAADQEVLKNITVDDEKVENAEPPVESKDGGESVVYAELDLGGHHVGPAVLVRGDDDKTEYAEIIHTQAPPK